MDTGNRIWDKLDISQVVPRIGNRNMNYGTGYRGQMSRNE